VFGPAFCVDCRHRFDPRTLSGGRCAGCRTKRAVASAPVDPDAIPADYWEKGLENAGVLAKFDGRLPGVLATIDALERWEGWLRGWLAERGRGAEGAEPCWRFRELPVWRRDPPRPYRYEGSDGD
jgi:hypothetical protein